MVAFGKLQELLPGRPLTFAAQQVFNAALAYYGRCQNEGLIESFDVVILSPSGAGINGYVQLHGSAEQLAALRENREFMRITVDAQMIVENLALIDGFANQGVADQVAMYQEAIAGVPQLT